MDTFLRSGDLIKIYLLQSNILWDFIDIIILLSFRLHWKFIQLSDNLEFTFWIYKLDYAKKWENNLKKSTQGSVRISFKDGTFLASFFFVFLLDET